MPNPNPSPATRFTALPEGVRHIRKQVYLRPDHVERLALEDNESAAIRAALDTYFTIHAPPDDTTDHGAALAAMAAEPAEIDEWQP